MGEALRGLQASAKPGWHTGLRASSGKHTRGTLDSDGFMRQDWGEGLGSHPDGAHQDKGLHFELGSPRAELVAALRELRVQRLGAPQQRELRTRSRLTGRTEKTAV